MRYPPEYVPKHREGRPVDWGIQNELKKEKKSELKISTQFGRDYKQPAERYPRHKHPRTPDEVIGKN